MQQKGESSLVLLHSVSVCMKFKRNQQLAESDVSTMLCNYMHQDPQLQKIPGGLPRARADKHHVPSGCRLSREVDCSR